MQTGRLLELRTLEELNTCIYSRCSFKNLFGDSVIVTVEECQKHINLSARSFTWSTGAKLLLSKTSFRSYVKTISEARKAFRAAKKPAELARKIAIEAGMKRSKANYQFHKTITPQRNACRLVEAAAFANAYNSDVI
jgi:hypothetical protein